MNLVLFTADELDQPLPRTDARALHLLGVLRRDVGDTFDAGVVNGAIAKGRIVAIGAEAVTWRLEPRPGAPLEPPVYPIDLVVGLPRPQTARKILQEATALGVRAIHFVRTEKGEAGYATSTLWSSGEWRRHVRAGLEQAFATMEPVVTHGLTLEEVWTQTARGCAIALDNYEAGVDLAAAAVRAPTLIAIGGERGWSAGERDFFRERQATLVHLGPRVLRAETACVAAVAIVRSRL